MLRNMLANKKNNDEGFTLIELLVVILIIGILAAIALPTFLGQSDKAKDSSAKSDARNAISQVESCLTDAATVTTCSTYTGKPGTVSITGLTAGTAPSATTYTVASTSKTNNVFTITKSSTGTYDRTCTTAKTGSCPSDGKW